MFLPSIVVLEIIGDFRVRRLFASPTSQTGLRQIDTRTKPSLYRPLKRTTRTVRMFALMLRVLGRFYDNVRNGLRIRHVDSVAASRLFNRRTGALRHKLLRRRRYHL